MQTRIDVGSELQRYEFANIYQLVSAKRQQPLVEDAGLLLITEWQRPEGPRGSGDKADVDVEIESLLKPRLLQLLDCDFWGEETDHRLTGARYCWVVDPNDGTADFLKSHKGSAISVGLLEDAQPVLGVVYAPVLQDGDSDCVAWAKGAPCVLRNGSPIKATLAQKEWNQDSRVMVSTAATNKPEINSELCSPGCFVAMPSIAYRLARVAAGDGDAGVSLVPVSAHDVAAGHALLIGAGTVRGIATASAKPSLTGQKGPALLNRSDDP